MAVYTITRVVRCSGLAGKGEPVVALVSRVQEIAGDLTGTLVSDPAAVVLRGLNELAEETGYFPGEALYCLTEGDTVVELPEEALGLDANRAVTYGTRPVRVPGEARQVSDGILRLEGLATQDSIQLEYDDTTQELRDDGAVVASGSDIQSHSGSTVYLSPKAPGAIIKADRAAAVRLLVPLLVYPSVSDWTGTTEIPHSLVRPLQEYLLWEILRYSEDEDDLRRASGAEARWNRALAKLKAKATVRARPDLRMTPVEVPW